MTMINTLEDIAVAFCGYTDIKQVDQRILILDE